MDPKDPNDIQKFSALYRKHEGADTTDLIIYGVLASQKMSGYDLFKILRLKREGLGPMVRANKAAVYSKLRMMEEEGEAEVVEVLKETNRPPKSIYRLTDKGKEKLKEMLRAELKRPPVVYFNTAGALALAQDLPPEELREILTGKVEQLDFLIALNESQNKLPMGPLLEVLGRSKLNQYKALRESLIEALEVIGNYPPETWFEWPDILKQSLWNMMTENEKER